MLTTGNITKLFDVSGQTVRNWTREFGDYLSPSATPKGVRGRRTYTVEDLSVFALIVERTQSGETYEDIKKALADGVRAEPPELQEDEPDIASKLTPREIVLLSQITKERDIALGQLKQLKEDSQADKEKIDRLNQQIGELKFEIRELKKRLNE